MTISIVEEAWDTIQYSFLIKTLTKLGIEENCLNWIKGISENLQIWYLMVKDSMLSPQIKNWVKHLTLTTSTQSYTGSCSKE